MPSREPTGASTGSLTVAVVSDTHLPRGTRELPDAVTVHVQTADLVVHAGDFTSPDLVERFRAMGPPLVAVHGNADEPSVRESLPATATVTCGGIVIGVVHNGGPESGRVARLRRRFPECGIVIFGHSHIPLLAGDDDLTILNPGSAADRRRQPHHSMALIRITAGEARVAFVRLDDPVGPLPGAFVRRAG